jgi:hypothetical protein
LLLQLELLLEELLHLLLTLRDAGGILRARR